MAMLHFVFNASFCLQDYNYVPAHFRLAVSAAGGQPVHANVHAHLGEGARTIAPHLNANGKRIRYAMCNNKNR